MNTKEVKEYAKAHGADLLGIASADRFKNVPPERSPLAIFPECQSVLVVGRRILRGALRGVEEGTNFGSTYGMFGYRGLEDNFLAQTTYDLTCFIETKNFEAVPLFGYAEDGMPQGLPVAKDKPAPNVIIDLEFAAQAAGLGEVGLGGFFLTAQYGPRQRFAAILTDAALEPDPISRKEICGGCAECAAACPFGAIDIHNRVKAGVPGVPGAQMEVATVNYGICRVYPNGAQHAPGRGSRPDRCAAACVRACVVKLEQAGKCGNKFTQQFRKRTPWLLDVFHQPCSAQDSKEAQPAHLGCGASAAFRKGGKA